MKKKKTLIIACLIIIVGLIIFLLCNKCSKSEPDEEETQSELTVPGYDEEAELSKVAPSYYPTADQQLLLLKGPVLGEKLTTTEYGDPSTSSFQLDHNGWIDKHPLFDGKDIERNEKMGNRIESAYDKEPCDIDDVYPGNNYAYYSDGWLKAVTMDTPCGEAVETYELNHYNDPLSTHTEGFLGDEVKWKKVYTVTKTDCFHNWLERDVKSYDNGNLVSQWHESRVLYYLQVIEAERSTVETRPIDRSSYETISSESGGLIYFKDGPKWRCYRVEATN